MFGHLFINKLKVLLRSKSMIFWSLIFPIALATFFNLAFANLTSDEKFSVIDIAVVENENLESLENFIELLNTISNKDEDQIFNIKYVKTEELAERALEDNEIKGYYIVNNNIDIVVKNNGLEQTIMKYVADNYYQVYSVMENIYKFNPAMFKASLIEDITRDGNYFKDISNTNIDFTGIYFYTLIGMVCINAGTFGIHSTKESEANLSKRGARVSISSINKLSSLLISLLVSLIIQYTEILILLFYLIFILGVNFGNQILYILLISLVGTVAGISFGTFVGVSSKKSDGVKVSILTSITMVFSFLSGMMIWQMKYIVEKNIPILSKINPVSMITDGLYSLYYYSDLTRYMYNIISLIVFSFLMISLSYLFIRRKKYDSI